MGDLVGVRILERAEEPLVALDVLAAIGLYASVNGALGAFVGECLGKAREFGQLDVLHGVGGGREGTEWYSKVRAICFVMGATGVY